MTESSVELADRAAVLAEADVAWQAFQAKLIGLTADDYERPGVEGVWSLKDTLGHLSAWHMEANAWLELYRRGEPFPPFTMNLDQFNAEAVALRAKADPLAILDELREQYSAWRRLLSRLPDERFTTALTRHWTVAALIHHFAEHTGAIDRARERAVSAN